MMLMSQHKKLSFCHRLGTALILLCFLNTTLLPTSYAEEIFLSAPGTMVPLSDAFNPPLLKGIKIYPNNPFRLDFILNAGNTNDSAEQTQTQATQLVKYFLTAVTVPEQDLWVNLSPYEKDRIIPNAFGTTEMGRDLLAQDYLLKQITASVTYPEKELGKKFWAKVHAETQKHFGTTDIPLNTFNKIWIVPQKAVVYENTDAAYVIEAHLKVMLEEDYVALEQNSSPRPNPPNGRVGNGDGKILRELILPILEKEVNEGENFTHLRQIYHSLILAIWFKDKIKQSIFGQAYIDRNKIAGVNIADTTMKEKIWTQYVQAFKQGTYNYVKEEVDPLTQETLPRKYFSGGAGLNQTSKVLTKLNRQPNISSQDAASSTIVTINLDPAIEQNTIQTQLQSRQNTTDTILQAASAVINPISKSSLTHMPKEERIRQLGQNIPGLKLGNKEAGFLLFNLLGLNYPPGLILPEKLVQDMLMQPDKESAAFISFIYEELKLAGIDPTKVRFSVRSNPKQSMPGILTTVTDTTDLLNTIGKVAMSWNSDTARSFRKRKGIPDNYDLPIIIEVWVSGQKRVFNPTTKDWDYDHNYQQARAIDPSLPFYGAGVFSTRNPNTNEPDLYGRFIENKNGDSLMTHGQAGEDIKKLAHVAPDIYQQLRTVQEAMEDKAGPQEIEFVVNNGQLYFLQTRNINFAPQAEMAYIEEQLASKKITQGIAIPRLEELQQRLNSRKIFKIKPGTTVPVVLAKAIASTRGALQGHLIWDIAKARELMRQNKPIIFVASHSNQEEILDIIFSYPHSGLMTNYGNNSSHETDLTRLAGIPALINLQKVEIITSGNHPGIILENGERLKEETLVVLDADHNALFIAQDNVLEEDSNIINASYGIDIPAFRKSFTAPFLDSNGNIKPEYTAAQLEQLNRASFEQYQELSQTGSPQDTFRANLEKHFLHQLWTKAVETESIEKPSPVASLPHLENVINKSWGHWSQDDLNFLIKLYSDPRSHQEEIKLLAKHIEETGHAYLYQDNYTAAWHYGISKLTMRILLKKILRAIYRKTLIFYVENKDPQEIIKPDQEILFALARALKRSPETFKRDIEFFRSHPQINDRLNYINENQGFLLYTSKEDPEHELVKFKKHQHQLGEEASFEGADEQALLHSIVTGDFYTAIIVAKDTPADILRNFGSFKLVPFSEYLHIPMKILKSSAYDQLNVDIINFIDNLPETLEETTSSSALEAQTKGGIDLTGEQMHRQLTTTGNNVEFSFTPQMIEQVQSAPGFTPIIINIQPLISLPLFLGLHQDAALTVATAEKL